MTRNFYSTDHAPYYIFAMDYMQQSAGVRALHYLCHALNESGMEAYLTCKITAPQLRTPLLTPAIVMQHQAAGRAPVMVYPEIVSGDPFGMSGVVARWLLNKPGLIGGDTSFDASELLFAYDKNYLLPGMQAEMLHIPTCDLSIFNNDSNPYDLKRDQTCYYAHKYLHSGGVLTHHIQGAISLCKDQKLSHHEIAAMLRRSRTIYVYEPTVMISEAMLCGCPVTVVENDYWRQHMPNYTYNRDDGLVMADSDESLEVAKANVHHYFTHYEKDVLRLAWEQLDRFIAITQEAVKARVAPASPDPGDTREPDRHEGDERYLSWRAARARDAGSGQLDGAGRDVSFHVLVIIADAAVGRLPETGVCGSDRLAARLTYVAPTPKPESLQLREGDAWAKLAAEDFADGLNRLLQEDDASDYLIFLDADDALEPHALNTIAAEFARHPSWVMAYADQDCMQADGSLTSPYFKSDLEPDRVRAAPFFCDGMLAIRRSALLQTGGLKCASYGTERFELMLRGAEVVGAHQIGHIADVLAHRRIDARHAAQKHDDINAARRLVLQHHLDRIGAKADVNDGWLPGTFHIRHHHAADAAVSIIIPTQNGGTVLQNSVNQIVANTAYKNWELIVVDIASDDTDTVAFLDYLRAFNNDAIRVLALPRTTSLPAALNAAAAISRQDYLLFLSDSTSPVHGDWLDELLGYAVQSGVGVVGAKGIGEDNGVSNACYILGLDGLPAAIPDLHAPQDAPGYFGRLQLPGNPSAVAATCMLTSQKLFDEIGGFDERELGDAYSDVDYCLKVSQTGQRVVWTPYAVMHQRHTTEPRLAAQIDDAAARTMYERWQDRIGCDPAYNRNLSLKTDDGKSAAFRIRTEPALDELRGSRVGA